MLRISVILLLVFTALVGFAYPLAITGIARLAFPRQAEGSLIESNGRVIGSERIGQQFAAPRFFHSRPSATTPAYAANASSGSNLGPTNPALVEAVRARVAALRAEDPDNRAPIPVDLVTASASGLDPEISPAAAEWQVARVARVRGIDPDRVRALVRRSTRERQFGLLGEPGVNVLELNLALDGLDGSKR